MNDTAVTFTNNKKYTKVNEYETLLTEEDNNSNESIKYKEKLIDYNKDYENYDYTKIKIDQKYFIKKISKYARYKQIFADQAS